MNKANKAQKSTYSDSINVEGFLKKIARNWHVQMVQFLQVPVPVPESQVPVQVPSTTVLLNENVFRAVLHVSTD